VAELTCPGLPPFLSAEESAESTVLGKQTEASSTHKRRLDRFTVSFVTTTVGWWFIGLLAALQRGVCTLGNGAGVWRDEKNVSQGHGQFRKEPLESHGSVPSLSLSPPVLLSGLNIESIGGSRPRDWEKEGEGLPLPVVLFDVFCHVVYDMQKAPTQHFSPVRAFLPDF
jgi:hypothetical protein